MSGTLEVLEERVLFAPGIAPEVNACLQAAVAHANDFERARALLYEAREIDPDALDVYIALYKFLFYRGKLGEAEEVAEQALKRAAAKGGFTEEWRSLEPGFAASDPETARIYLYSMKALAFINLRSGNHELGRAILDKLLLLDPKDEVGGSVIMDLAEALEA